MSETFILVHGSWHGGWAWHAVMRPWRERISNAEVFCHAADPGNSWRLRRAVALDADARQFQEPYLERLGRRA
jgi:hypothetical protein